MKSIYQMELEDKFNRKIKYREKKLKNQRMIIGKQQEEVERLNKQLQLISDEFLKYDWENSSKEQIINQLKSLYNSIFKGSDKE